MVEHAAVGRGAPVGRLSARPSQCTEPSKEKLKPISKARGKTKGQVRGRAKGTGGHRGLSANPRKNAIVHLRERICVS